MSSVDKEKSRNREYKDALDVSWDNYRHEIDKRIRHLSFQGDSVTKEIFSIGFFAGEPHGRRSDERYAEERTLYSLRGDLR